MNADLARLDAACVKYGVRVTDDKGDSGRTTRVDGVRTCLHTRSVETQVRPGPSNQSEWVSDHSRRANG